MGTIGCAAAITKNENLAVLTPRFVEGINKLSNRLSGDGIQSGFLRLYVIINPVLHILLWPKS